MLAGGAHQLQDIALDGRADMDAPHRLLHRDQLLAAGYCCQVGERIAQLEPLHDAAFLVLIRIAQGEADKEAIKLRFGQGEGAFKLDRILGGQHQEGAGQRQGRALDADLALLHRFQQRRLRARPGAVDLIGKQDLAKYWAGVTLELFALLVVDGHAGDVGGEQIGGELHPLEAAGQRLRQRLRQRGLAHPWHILDQHVAVGE